MQVSHVLPTAGMTSSFVFDEPNLIAHAGLVPALSLAEQTGLFDLVRQHLTLSGPGSAYAAEKVAVLIAGMLTGADSIDDMDLLRHGGTKKILTELRAPSTLGTFLRIFTHGHVRQLDAVNSRMLLNLQTATTSTGAPLLPDADQLAYVDIDDTIRQTYGYAKQGAGYGYSKVKGLNAMILTATTPTSASMILGARLRKGSTASARGASKLLADGLATLKRTADPNTTSGSNTSAGLLFRTYRYHAVFTDSPMSMLVAEKAHRAHAIVESTIAELKDNALAHLPSGKFQANAAWLMLAVVAHNLTRALAALAGAGHRRERMSTIRRKLISLPARIASSARKLRLHAPQDWRWQAGFDNVLAAIEVLARPAADRRLRT